MKTKGRRNYQLSKYKIAKLNEVNFIKGGTISEVRTGLQHTCTDGHNNDTTNNVGCLSKNP